MEDGFVAMECIGGTQSNEGAFTRQNGGDVSNKGRLILSRSSRNGWAIFCKTLLIQQFIFILEQGFDLGKNGVLIHLFGGGKLLNQQYLGGVKKLALSE